MGAYPSQDSGQRQTFHDDIEGLLIITDFDHLHIALYIGSGRAGDSARGRCPFVNHVSDRHGLGERQVNSFSHFSIDIPFIGEINRADLCTVTTSCTIGFDVSCLIIDRNLEVTHKPADMFNFTIAS